MRAEDREREIQRSFGNNPERKERRDQTVHQWNETTFSGNPSQTLDHHHQHTIKTQKTVGGPNTEMESHHDSDPDPTPVSTRPSPPLTNHRSRTHGEHPAARYRECQKNHAAASGGHVVDGCGEFMPAGEEDTPEALKCAACECHRSFHRKEIDGQDSPLSPLYHTHINKYNHHVLHGWKSPRKQHQVHPTAQIETKPMTMNFAESSSEDLNMVHHHRHHHRSNIIISNSTVLQKQKGSKKRFRTKFNREQKEKMFEFAEKLGWRIQKKDEQEVERFCSEVNVKRRVLKVWMHNTKQNMKKKK